MLQLAQLVLLWPASRAVAAAARELSSETRLLSAFENSPNTAVKLRI